MKKSREKQKYIVGWREWAHLPELGIDEIKVKIDTGAKTSAIHAFDISTVTYKGKEFVKFDIHPYQDNDEISHTRVHPIHDFRWITSSTGHKQKRFIIQTVLKIGTYSNLIELSLAKRDEMGFRMLVGRSSLDSSVLVNPKRSFLLSHKNILTKK